MKILIADDDPTLLTFLEKVLRDQRHDVHTCTNGKDALKCLKHSKYDILITDLVMPEQDGVQLIVTVHKLHNVKHIIAMSGGSERLQKDLLLECAGKLGAHTVLHKPFEIDQLLNAVRKVA